MKYTVNNVKARVERGKSVTSVTSQDQDGGHVVVGSTLMYVAAGIALLGGLAMVSYS